MSCAKPFSLLAVFVLAASAADSLARDLSSIVAVPAQGQSADRARRDRYECHNWAIGQTGTVPLPAPRRDAVKAERRAERIGRVIAGASIGAAAGSIIRGARDRREAADGALAGGILGAIVGASTGRRDEAAAEDAAFDAYYRALSACLTGRGYEVFIAADR